MQPPREFPNARKYIFQVPQLFYQPDVALGLILKKRQDKTGMAFLCGVVVASSAAGNSCYTDREESEDEKRRKKHVVELVVELPSL